MRRSAEFIIKKWTKNFSILIPGIPNEPVVVSNLSHLFEDYRKAEKCYLKCSYRAEKSRLFTEFKVKRCYFDKEYRKAKRSYNIDLKIGIVESETQNPKDFWNKLKSLGRANSKKGTS